MALEELEKELYSARRRPKKRRKILQEEVKKNEVPETWFESEASGKGKKKILANPFFWLVAVSLTAAFGLSFFFVSRFCCPKGIVLDVESAEEVLVGVPFEFKVFLSNSTKNVLKQSRLNIHLPEAVAELGGKDPGSVIDVPLGDIGGGSSIEKSFTLIATAEAEIIKRIRTSLIYEVKALGAGSRYEESRNFDVRIKDSGIFLDFVMPSQVISGEDFEIDLAYKNVAQLDFRGLEIHLEYPANFSFSRAEPKPSQSVNVWRLGDLVPEAEGELRVMGSLVGPADAVAEFNISLYGSFSGKDYLLNEKTSNVSIAPSPFSMSILLNDSADYIAKIGDRLFYELKFKNTSDVPMIDVRLKARLIGELFNFAALKSAGIFDSVTNTLTWNTATNPELRLLPPGAAGSVSFDLFLKDSFPIQRLNDKNYFLKVSAEVESPTVPEYIKASRTSAVTAFETKVAGLVQADTRVYFRDAESGILNSGPVPPKVNQPTQYTVHLVIKNYSTDISNVQVRTSLPPAVRWTGMVKSNTGSLPVYDERTGGIVWLTSKIPATKGIVSEPAETIFQIETTPAVNQIGQHLPLVGPLSLTATDDFTGLELVASDAGVDTSLPDDPTVSGAGRVVP